jgi:chromosome segregation ATPase
MFDVPFNLPSDSLYKKLGLEPTATSAEISNTINRRIGELNRELRDVRSTLDLIYQKVPELTATLANFAALKNNNNARDELAKVQETLKQLEAQATAFNSQYPQLRERLDAIENETLELNRNRLNSSGNRQLYNDATSLFALLQISGGSYDYFSDNRAVVTILRTDLSQFLEAAAEPVYYPNDVVRNNFEFEFSPNRLLDGFDDKSG